MTFDENTALAPQFLGIGAQRAATTWLYQVLRHHPDVFVSEKKEVHYFDENYDRGHDWYLDHFSAAPPGRLRGEITPNYLDCTAAAGRIANDLPNVKLFAVLREPVSRARSSYELLRHRFPGKSFVEACQPGGYLVDLGLYAKHLRRFYELFDETQIHIILYDDLQADPETVLSGLYDFLGISHQPVPEMASQGTNSVLFPRTQRLIQTIGLGGAVELAKRGGVGDAIRYVGRQAKRWQRSRGGGNNPHLHSLFADDIRELERLIGKDLSRWRR